MSDPLLVMLAGPNGGGKSTCYQTFLSGLGLPFLNADRLVDETGLGVYEAAAVIAETRRALIERSASFVSETVLSDPVGEKISQLEAAVRAGFDVQLIYIGISDVDMSIQRVATRVLAGGHDVPEEKLRARYARTLDNLERGIAVLPLVTLFDNSSYDEPYRLVAEFRDGGIARRGVGEVPSWAERFVG